MKITEHVIETSFHIVEFLIACIETFTRFLSRNEKINIKKYQWNRNREFLLHDVEI